MKHLITLILAVLSALLLSGCGAYEFRGTVLEPPNPAPEIPLVDQFGNEFRLSNYRDKIVLVFFGFTHCPDICPTALGDLKRVMEKLGNDAAKVQVVFVSVDPERDTPDLMQRYLAAFNPTFLGLNGDRAVLEQVYKSYGVTVIKRELPNSGLGYTIDHSGYIYAIDQAGNWRLLWAHGTPVDDIVSDVQALLRNPPRG
ncbi:MAG TPA: SCO family protein [Chloroflexus aurantiacus]|jgi:protein SCO1/2|uniref:Electron transport protein SCO1/SenC n=1 Tax=Chloroflexus aurantiacus (strain ATCC 29366 / DSM 635 / J-10-fl) TaxID=324602 RepID=A9WEQ3_CHLAA|nr:MULTISPECIES: SCO family protein [Chloroflexus]ABY33812.1 electron transport protein SCO1/SenC [Chloroflexus aurantiacus J-10-fl]RMG46644.1 MAG: SCO family protein [Chloroflexota bacterium]GIV95122.1 MAG: electron transporter SenC [Chloroflexus sp.]HBW69348.1 SCO family protein [Chloroflexus aurantiacus]